MVWYGKFRKFQGEMYLDISECWQLVRTKDLGTGYQIRSVPFGFGGDGDGDGELLLNY